MRIPTSIMLAAVISTLPTLAWSQTADDRCNQERQFALQRGGDSVCQSAVGALFDMLGMMSKQEQRVALARIQPAVKSALWRMNLDRFLSQHVELTDEQVAAIHAARAFLTPSHFMIVPGSPRWDEHVRELAPIKERIRALLPDELEYEAFYGIGLRLDQLAATNEVQECSQSLVVAGSGPTPNTGGGPCTCYAPIDCGWDYWNYVCQVDIHCTPVPNMCGWWGWDACDGHCFG